MCVNSIISKYCKASLAAMLLAVVSFTHADDLIGKSEANSFVTLDFSINPGESWDAEDKPANITANCINGETITGFEYNDITIQTFGGSYFSEAIIYFSDSNGEDGLRLAIGFGNETAGTAIFNSNGIIDITDTGNEDVESLADNKFLMQFYEIVDDAQNALDARFANGTLKVWGINLEASSDCPFIKGAIVEEADLSVSYEFEAENVSFVGETILFDITIDNEGGTEASTVVLTNNLSDKLQFLQLSCSDDTLFTDGDSVSFELSNIPAGGSLSCVLESRVIDSGQIFNDITVGSDIDSDDNNNSASMMIRGAAIVVPVNNILALLILVFGLLFFVRRRLLN